jgi:hypothetical protein
MRKLTIALVAAITVGATLPAAAQVGFYAGPSGIGIGIVAPGYYGGPSYYPQRHFHHWHTGTTDIIGRRCETASLVGDGAC